MGQPTNMKSEPVSEKSVEELREEIRSTRHEMNQTLNELKSKIAPEQLRAEARHQIHDATLGRAEKFAENMGMNTKYKAQRFAHRVQENPIPAAIAAVGLGWLFMSDNRPDPEYYRTPRYTPQPLSVYDYHDPYLPNDEAELRAAGYHYARGMYPRENEPLADYDSLQHDEDSPSAARQKMEQAREGMHHMKEQARERAYHAKERARESLHHGAERARESFHHGAERASYEARMRAQQAQREYSHQMRHNPMGVGLAAMALGALVGLVVKETRWEHEHLGPTRDQLLAEAQYRGADALDKAAYMARQKREEMSRQSQENEHGRANRDGSRPTAGRSMASTAAGNAAMHTAGVKDDTDKDFEPAGASSTSPHTGGLNPEHTKKV